MVHGTRFEVSTRCVTLRAAMGELERFEADPESYRGGGDVGGALLLDDKIAGRFLDAQGGNDLAWHTRQRKLVAWWSSRLRGVDLRKATLRDHILPAIPAKGRKDRIAVIKHLYSWLREEDMIAATEDPCLGKLKLPQARPAQLDRSKVVPVASYRKVRVLLSPEYQAALDVLAGTGWHTTEIRRFAMGGTIDRVGRVTVIEVKHKNGSPHRTRVSAEVAKAAALLRAHGGLGLSRFHRAVLAACDEAKVPRFRPGWFRHTIATLAVEAGEESLVPGFLGHRSSTTTKRFYSTRATPPKVTTLR
jgi:integrase